jgi:hypothetical protein
MSLSRLAIALFMLAAPAAAGVLSALDVRGLRPEAQRLVVSYDASLGIE